MVRVQLTLYGIPIGYWSIFAVREHFSSPLLQFSEKDVGETFTLVECPSTSHLELGVQLPLANLGLGGTGQLISRLTNNEIDIAMCAFQPYLDHLIILAET
jgi:hypothetical protein